MSRVRTGAHAYRQLGPRHGTATLLRHLATVARGRVRALILTRQPISLSPGELEAALGDCRPTHALARAADALPSVRRWAAALSELTPGARANLLRRADEVVAHRFDLLGSGPTDLGPMIDWQRDFKSGRSWPLCHISRVPVSFPDTSDIKVPWELSRFQHLPLLAAAWRLTGERRYLDELGAQLTTWVAANPVEFGVNWACTMDVGIRAVNWIAAVVLCAEAAGAEAWLNGVLGSLLLHGRFIRGHLEYGSARGNHYLSNIVGLLVVSSVFGESAEGQAWARWAIRELSSEMRHQVRPDGCDHEASIAYHRLVTELFIIGADAADVLAPGLLDPDVRAGIERMLQFVADYIRPDGLAPQIGDVDNGRLLPLADYGSADQRSHLHLFRQAQRSYHPADRSAGYPDGGFYFLRSGTLYCAVRCGDVGIYGRGCHAHNDLMAFELNHESTPLVVDPGSYVYSADPGARNRFRSTAAHSTLQLDDAEQNEIREDRLFAMVDRARPEVLRWASGETATTLVARHHGFEALPHPATHVRTLHVNGVEGMLEIIDEVISDGPHELTWSFPLAPCTAAISDGCVEAHFSGVTLHIISDGGSFAIEEGWLSPSYGVQLPSPLVRLRGQSEPGQHRTTISLRVTSIKQSGISSIAHGICRTQVA